jgi:hypothetical protein
MLKANLSRIIQMARQQKYQPGFGAVGVLLAIVSVVALAGQRVSNFSL